MSFTIFEKVLVSELSYYLALDDIILERCLRDSNLVYKERVNKIDDLEILIYSNDHNPPHFHVKSNDLKINAKFTIDSCELISGIANSKQIKRIKAFHLSPKGRILMEAIWNKRLM
jgi:hypothetical protein